MKLAVESGAPVVPVAISGSYDVFERTGFIEKTNVSISFGQAIDQSTLPHEHKRQALSDAAHQAIAEMLSCQPLP
jgi:1-acyl-sn-glycerol-3-phosphate acyltransferase